MASNAHIIASLKEIAWLLSLRKEDFFRSRAYKKAADVLVRYEGDLEALIERGEVCTLSGVGTKTALVVGELHQTGRSHLLSELRRRFPREVGRLARIPGLGLARLQTLHDALGIETAEDLRRACVSGALAGVRGFGPSTVKKIQSALSADQDAPRRILLPHAREIAASLLKQWRPILGDSLEVTGALRRREAAIERVELVAVGRDRPELPMAEDWSAVSSPISEFPLEGWQGVLREGLPVVLWLAPRAQFGAVLAVTTGPSDLARRALAQARVTDDERAFFESASLPWWPPEIRDAMQVGAPAPRLVERSELQGLVHAHTTDSDGRDDLRTLAREAKALGYAYLTITDHSPSAQYAGGLSLEDLARQGELIRDVEAEVGIRILRGTESDIRAEGGLDHPIEVLERLDLVIASLHGRFRLDAEAMTERLLKTFDLPVRMIWGHPLGRLVLSRPPIEADLPRIFDRMAERGHILEVNGDPHRMDLPPEWIRQARQRGIPFVLSADAHSVRGLRMADTAVDCARAGGLGPSDVLNTLDPQGFVAAVAP